MLTHLIPPVTLHGRYDSFPHFSDEATKAQRGLICALKNYLGSCTSVPGPAVDQGYKTDPDLLLGVEASSSKPPLLPSLSPTGLVWLWTCSLCVLLLSLKGGCRVQGHPVLLSASSSWSGGGALLGSPKRMRNDHAIFCQQGRPAYL